MSQTFQVGQRASVTRTISESDVYLFAGITGDLNPAHTNEEYAKKTHFKTRIAHGMLSAGLISAVLGMKLPGPGTIYTGQTIKFLAPVHIGDTITATAEIQSLGSGPQPRGAHHDLHQPGRQGGRHRGGYGAPPAG